MAIRVLIIDDHPIFRAGLRALLGTEPDIDVVGDATGTEAIHTVEDAQPDVITVDISMPGLTEASLIAPILAARPSARVLVLTMHSDVMYVRWAFEHGAKG
jgi:DNA-binding NarL/FixJ family response regulator